MGILEHPVAAEDICAVEWLQHVRELDDWPNNRLRHSRWLFDAAQNLGMQGRATEAKANGYRFSYCGLAFDIQNPTAEQTQGIDRAVAFLKRGVPTVFVNGLRMSNPSVEKTIAVYRADGGGGHGWQQLAGSEPATVTSEAKTC